MAFRYPPPPIGKLRPEQLTPQFTPVMNFNIPPPGFRPSYTNEAHQYLPLLSQPQESKGYFREEMPEHTAHEVAISTEVIPCAPQRIQDWLQKLKIHHRNVANEETPQTLKIYEAKQLLKICLSKIKELNGLQNTLKSNYRNLNDSAWKEKWNQVRNLRAEIDRCLKKLDNPTTLTGLKKLLMARSKKRKREKKKRAEHKEMTAEYRTRRQQMHDNIDKWLKNMQEVVERAKREESLKHEADQVLAEVTRRKHEARRQLNMLKALQKLRRIRIQTVTNRGQQVDAESGIRFTKVVEHLLKLWTDQLKEYEIEEQGLRVMLEEAVEERTKSEISQIKLNFRKWEELLFGKRGPPNDFYQSAERDMESFVEVRKSWDNFLAPPGAAMSSSIPVGWVLPSHPSSDSWESLLTGEK